MSNMLHKRLILTRKRCRKCGSRDMYNKPEYGIVCASCGWRYKNAVNPEREYIIENEEDERIVNNMKK